MPWKPGQAGSTPGWNGIAVFQRGLFVGWVAGVAMTAASVRQRIDQCGIIALPISGTFHGTCDSPGGIVSCGTVRSCSKTDVFTTAQRLLKFKYVLKDP